MTAAVNLAAIRSKALVVKMFTSTLVTAASVIFSVNSLAAAGSNSAVQNVVVMSKPI